MNHFLGDAWLRGQTKRETKMMEIAQHNSIPEDRRKAPALAMTPFTQGNALSITSNKTYMTLKT